jgi:hypothetical protein
MGGKPTTAERTDAIKLKQRTLPILLEYPIRFGTSAFDRMTHLMAPWKTLLQKSLQQNSSLPYSKYMQLATVRPDGKPANRTVVFRCVIDVPCSACCNPGVTGPTAKSFTGDSFKPQMTSPSSQIYAQERYMGSAASVKLRCLMMDSS